jgi:hypothetical protein
MCNLLFWGGVFFMFVMSKCSTGCSSPLVTCWCAVCLISNRQSLIEINVLIFHAIISSCNSVSVGSIYLGALLLGAAIFIIYISLVNHSFVSFCNVLLFIVFDFKCILFNKSGHTLLYFGYILHRITFFHAFTFILWIMLDSYRQHIVGPFFNPLAMLCLLIGEYNLFTFKVINEKGVEHNGSVKLSNDHPPTEASIWTTNYT